MIHARRLATGSAGRTAPTLSTVVDPTTGRTYPVPAGGAGDDDGNGDGDDGQGDSQDGDSGQDGAGGNSDDSQDGDTGRAGGDNALRADLARERKRRQTAEKALRDRERDHETDTDRIRREAQDEVLTPARAQARRHAIEHAARTSGWRDPDDAYAALFAAGVLDDIEVDDATLRVDDTDAVATALAAVAKRKPHLLTDEARAELEGRSTSSGTGSSVDGSTSNGRGGSPSSAGGWLQPTR